MKLFSYNGAFSAIMKWRVLMLSILLRSFGCATAAPLKEFAIAVIGERPRVSIDAPSYLPLLIEGAKLAVEERSQEFARIGMRLQIREYYTEGGTLVSRDRMKEVLSGDTVGAVGIFSTDDAVLMVPQLSGTDYLVVSPYTTSAKLSAFQPNFLQYIPSNLEMAKATEHLLAQNLASKKVVAIVAWDSPNSKDFYESLSDTFRKNTFLIKTLEDLPELTSIAKEALSHQPDTILLPNYPVCSATLIKALTNAGFKGTFLGNSSWGEGSDPRFMKIVGNTRFDALSIRFGSKFHLSDAENALKDKLAKRSQVKYVMGAGLYYDTTNYLLDLVRDSGQGVNRAKVLALSKERRVHKGVTGLKCISSSECTQPEFVVLRVDDRGFRLLTPDLYRFSGNPKESNGTSPKN